MKRRVATSISKRVSNSVKIHVKQQAAFCSRLPQTIRTSVSDRWSDINDSLVQPLEFEEFSNNQQGFQKSTVVPIFFFTFFSPQNRALISSINTLFSVHRRGSFFTDSLQRKKQRFYKVADSELMFEHKAFSHSRILSERT